MLSATDVAAFAQNAPPPLLSTMTYTISGKYMQDGEDQSYIVMMSNSPTLQQDGGKNSSVQFLCVASNSSVS